jgi:hypothetical protein
VNTIGNIQCSKSCGEFVYYLSEYDLSRRVLLHGMSGLVYII